VTGYEYPTGLPWRDQGEYSPGQCEGVIKREGLVGERNRREDRNEPAITVRRPQSTEVSQIPRLHVVVLLV
jgi:hypothetical protein